MLIVATSRGQSTAQGRPISVLHDLRHVLAVIIDSGAQNRDLPRSLGLSWRASAAAVNRAFTWRSRYAFDDAWNAPTIEQDHLPDVGKMLKPRIGWRQSAEKEARAGGRCCLPILARG